MKPLTSRCCNWCTRREECNLKFWPHGWETCWAYEHTEGEDTTEKPARRIKTRVEK